MIHLITGGRRSGKSLYAEQCAASRAEHAKSHLVYIATAQPVDEEMQARIDLHIVRRGAEWKTIEAPLMLAEAIISVDLGHVMLIDCLSVWLTNLIHHKQDIDTAISQFTEALAAAQFDIIIVTNETGLGIIPADSISRKFSDQAGELNQRIAQLAEKIDLIIMGIPLALKSEKT